MTKLLDFEMMKVTIKKSLSHRRLRAITLVLVFVISGVGGSLLINPVGAVPNTAAPVAAAGATPSPAQAALTSAEANWAEPDGNNNQNYNPQTQINATSAKDLGLAWLYPVPPRDSVAALVNYPITARASQGVDTTPITVNGTTYILTQYGEVIALNTANGDQIWTKVLPVSLNATADIKGVADIQLHEHDGSMQYTCCALFGGNPTLWVAAPDLKIYAVNAFTGAIEMNFTYFTGVNNVPGDSPEANQLEIAPNILVDQSKGIAITSIGNPSSAEGGRCVYNGWNVLQSPPQLIWQTFCTPPQPGGNLPLDPNWDISQVQNMTGAEIFYPGPSADNGGLIPNNNGQAVVNLKTLSPAVLNSTLYNDWGQVDQSHLCSTWDGGYSTGSTSAGWGAPWLLGSGPTAGMAFVNTNNRDPFGGPCNPGPDLWAASVLALNESTGAWIWGFQATPHDEMDYDCSWWQALGNETVNGVNTPVLWKTCKNGYLYELNALTGNLIWAWTSPQSQVPRAPHSYILNPLNSTQMDQAYFNPAAMGAGQATITNPSSGAGFEDEQSYDPALNYLFVANQNDPALEYYVPPTNGSYATYSSLAGAGAVPYSNPDNTTITAINAATGATVWSAYQPLTGYRGGLSNSGGLVFVTLLSGDMDMYNATNGNLVRDYYIGGPLEQIASVASTDAGKEEVIMSIDAGDSPETPPGDIFALSIQPVTGTTTTTTTVTGGMTTVTASTTVTSVTTFTATMTSTTGVSSTALYGVAAVAVIFIIITGYLAMTRGRKPAS
jgi:outer membrane protein assembly factor BamB